MKSLVCKILSAENPGHWLMVVDDANDSEVLLQDDTTAAVSTKWVDYLPSGDRGAIIFTTRSRKLANDLSSDKILELKDLQMVGA